MYSQNRNYSAHHEAQKELSRTAHTESNDQKIGFAKQPINVAEVEKKGRQEAMANKQKLNQTTNIFGDDHLANGRGQPQKRQGYNLLTGESYDAPKPAVSAPPKTVSQSPKVDNGPIQSNVRKGIAPVYVKNW